VTSLKPDLSKAVILALQHANLPLVFRLISDACIIPDMLSYGMQNPNCQRHVNEALLGIDNFFSMARIHAIQHRDDGFLWHDHRAYFFPFAKAAIFPQLMYGSTLLAACS
jgi:hypothetical protein